MAQSDGSYRKVARERERERETQQKSIAVQPEPRLLAVIIPTSETVLQASAGCPVPTSASSLEWTGRPCSRSRNTSRRGPAAPSREQCVYLCGICSASP